MNDNAKAIAVFCSHLAVGEKAQPLEPREWSVLAAALIRKGMQPAALLELDRQGLMQVLDTDEVQAERMARLIDRSAALSFEISKYESMGVSLLTRADAAYPTKLKQKLGNVCPPLFYTAGDMTISQREFMGCVGSRTVGDADAAFTRQIVQRTVERDFAIVSGGAKGCDTVAEEESLSCGGYAMAFLSDSMLRKLRNTATVRAVQQGKLLLLSVARPDAGFNTGLAMMRNKYIYASSTATVVVKTDYNRGGTWAGATENLKHRWSLTLCRQHNAYPGNKALIEKGAVPIGEDWDGDIKALLERKAQEEPEQLSLF